MNSFENEEKNDVKNAIESTTLFSSAKSSRKFAIILKQFVKRRRRALSTLSLASSSLNVVDSSSSSIALSLKKKRKIESKIKNVSDQTNLSIASVKKKKSKSKKLAKRILFVSAFFRPLFNYEKKLELNANVK